MPQMADAPEVTRAVRSRHSALRIVALAPNLRGAQNAAAAGAQYRIAGKSGTAQVVAIKQGERYNREKTLERHRDNALFVGFAPAERPKIAISVMIENGEAGGRSRDDAVW